MRTVNKYSYISILLFLVAMYSIGTISAITESWTITLFMLFVSLGFYFFMTIQTKRIIITPIAVAWIFVTLICFSTVTYGVLSSGIIFYGISAVLLIYSSYTDPSSLYKSMKILKLAGILFAIGCYWQYTFPDQYYSWLFPQFGSSYHESITRQFTYNKMCTGFTNQTAVSAQFIILGIMAVIYSDLANKKQKKTWISIIELIILAGGLFLTGKRSPILNFGIAYFAVDICTIKRSKLFGRLLLTCALIGILILAVIYLAPLFSESESRNAIVRLMEFNSDVEDGGDFSNGRLFLAAIALSYFLDNPIIGIGWGKFGALNDITGVHNIYLQLLCECGVIGFIIAVWSMLYIYRKTISMLKLASRLRLHELTILIKCSVFIQSYILIYGFLGNPIYDQNYLLMYIYGLIISSCVYCQLRQHTATQVRYGNA